MNPVFKPVIRKRMAEITPNELRDQASNYHIHLSNEQASQIVKTIRSQNLDPFKKENLAEMLQQLERITDRETVQKAKILLNQLIKQYDLQSWFK